MSDTESSVIKVNIKSSGDNLYSVEVAEDATVSVLKDKIAEASGVAKEQQRLVFSGRILKDPETVSSYKIKDGNAIHLVKSAPKKAPEVQAAASDPTANVPAPSALTTGQETGNPLSDLTGARYSGLASLPSASMFGPDGGQGPTPSMADMEEMLFSNPELIQQAMSEFANADINDPIYKALPPDARQEMHNALNNPIMQGMLQDPERLRHFMRASMQLQQLTGGGNRFGQGAGAGGFPQPGNPEAPNDQQPGQAGPSGFPDLGNLDSLQSMLRDLQGAQGSSNPFGMPPMDNAALSSLLGGIDAAPADNRPPEEKYETQLGMLNELGFFDFDRNVKALKRSGGNVEGAVEALLDNLV